MKAWKALSCRRRRPGRQARPQAPPYQPRLERLEGRCVPAAFLVSTAADEGPGSPLMALAGSAAAGREDLLSAVLHEMGHLAGSPDGGAGLMAGTLAAGTRDLGALDAVFARQAP